MCSFRLLLNAFNVVYSLLLHSSPIAKKKYDEIGKFSTFLNKKYSQVITEYYVSENHIVHKI